MLIYDIRYIPKPLEDAYFRTLERLMIKASHFIKGYSFKKGGNVEHGLLKLPRRGGLETHCSTLFISTMNNYSLQSMPCLKAFLIPAETCIFMWLGYMHS